MAVDKIDPKVIFASEAPAQDAPAVFTNKTVGWGESRKNGGRPTIKQSNALQQETDLKILWLNENSVTPFDANIDYPENAVTIKDGVFKILESGVWELFLSKSSVGLGNVDNTSDINKPISTATAEALNLKADKDTTYTKVEVDASIDLLKPPYLASNVVDGNQTQAEINLYGGKKYDMPVGGYPSDARVLLDNGDIVKSTIANNTNDPNMDMTGWIDTDNGISIVSELSSIIANDENRIFVKNFAALNLALAKPYLGGGGGNFEFVADSVDTPDNVRTFAGVGGIWKRVNWLNPTIYDAGIIDESLDNTDKFKALLSATAAIFKGKKEIDLDNRTLKVTDFIMYSNMFIKNGGLDFRGSTAIDASNFAYAGLIIGENAPYRNLDPQVHTRYAGLPVISNFGFDNVEFTSPVATNNIRRNIMTFYKWKGFKMLRCKFNLNGARAYKLVGSFNNTDYTGLGLWDQPEPFGGYSSKAKIKFNEFVGTGYSQTTGGANIMSDTGQFAAVEDVEFSFNSSKNLMMGCHFDAYTRNSSSHHNNYEIMDDMISAFTNASVLDVIGVYVGQCGYGNSIYKNKIKNAIRHSVYVEAGSDVDIRSNKIKHSAALVATNPSVAHGITIQANLISDATSGTTFNKGCEDIEISGNTIKGLRQGIVVSSTIADSARAINIHDNTDVKVSGNLAAIYVTNAVESQVHDNKCVGGIHLGRMLDCTVKNNRAKNTSNYALYLTAGLKTGTIVEGNDLSCDSGAVIYNGTTSGEVLNIQGGALQQTAGTATIQNGSGVGAVRCYGFDNNVARKQFTYSEAINLTAGQTKLVTVSHTGIKNGWLASVSLNSMGSLYTGSSIILNIRASAKTDAVDLLITNAGTATVNFTPNYSISLESYADNTFTN